MVSVIDKIKILRHSLGTIFLDAPTSHSIAFSAKTMSLKFSQTGSFGDSLRLTKILSELNAAIVIKPITDMRHQLHDSELILLKNVSAKRILEFSTGRYCARQALNQVGEKIIPILKGKQREPLWPETIVGSISHCRDLAGAIVARKQNLQSVGIDIENRKSVNPNIAKHICTPMEVNWLEQQSSDDLNLYLLLIFSLKEAVFKCIHQLNGYALRFSECEISPNLNIETANIIINTKQPTSKQLNLSAHFKVTRSHIYSYVFSHI